MSKYSATTPTTDDKKRGQGDPRDSVEARRQGNARFPTPSAQARKAPKVTPLNCCQKALLGLGLTTGIIVKAGALFFATLWASSVLFSTGIPFFLAPLAAIDPGILIAALALILVIGIVLTAVTSKVIHHRRKTARQKKVFAPNPFVDPAAAGSTTTAKMETK